MSLTVSPGLIEQAQRGEIDDAAFTSCIAISLPYAWQVITGTYRTTNRGVDRLLFVNNILDLAPYGRQEDWEDSPPGWPQHPTYG
jgi:hypothetical protein